MGRISIDPKICFGKQHLKATRIWVTLILDWLASGRTVLDILKEYPDLEEADALACVPYCAQMARERYADIPMETAS